MVTVLAGVLPLVSPNNNARKLREASRQLNSLLAQAQAQAARDGRPVGVAFRETGAGNPDYSGMALEAYIVAEPAPFAGFSEHSRVAVTTPSVTMYGSATGANGGTLFTDFYDGYPVDELTFTLADQATPDDLPPRMLRFGDVVAIGSYEFMIVDDSSETTVPNITNGDPVDPTLETTNVLHCVWINKQPGQLYPQGIKTYRIRRQISKGSDSPLQFPRGIGIDLLASGAEGLTAPNSFDDFNTTTAPKQIDVLFDAKGSLDSIFVNKIRNHTVEQVYLLMGLFENGNNGAMDHNDYDFAAGTVADDELAQRRTRINWLNPDSRWVSVNRAGRIITAENNISFDPRVSPHIDGLTGTAQENIDEQRRRQLNNARQNASNMSGSTGR
jgi:type II secretory pathway pseudopilin PulG